MHLIGQNKQSKFTCNTLSISPVTMTCTEICCQTTWGHIPWPFAKFGPGKRHLRRITSAKHSQKSGVKMLAFDWLEQPVKIDCSILNIFPARMTCAELCCQFIWEHFPQHCVQFEPWRRQLGYFVYDISIFLKLGILNGPFCSIFVPFHFYLVMKLM